MTRLPDSLEKDEGTLPKLQLANKGILQKYYRNIIKIFKHYQNMALPSETKGRQNQYHEDQKYVDFMHHYSVLCRSTNKRKLIRNSYESLPCMKNSAQRTSAPRRLPASPAYCIATRYNRNAFETLTDLDQADSQYLLGHRKYFRTLIQMLD